MVQNKVIQFFDRLMAFSFYALIFFIPISIALVEIFTALAFLSYVFKRSIIFIFHIKKHLNGGQPVSINSFFKIFIESFRPPASSLNKPIAVWILVCALSIILSQRPHLSINAFLGKTLQNAFIFFNFVEAINSRKRLSIFLTSFFTSCFFVCLSGINQYFLGMDFIRLNTLLQGRVNSCFRAPNDFAVYLVVTISIVLGMIFFTQKRSKSAVKLKPWLTNNVKFNLIVLLFLAVGCLGLTYSRGAWLSFGLSLILLTFNNWKLMIKTLLGGAVFVAFFAYKLVKERSFIDLTNLFGGFGRTIYWQEAINIVKDNPFVGVGLNTYSIVARKYKIGWGGYPHNCYLQIMAELGIIGFSVFIWLISTLFKDGYRQLKTMSDPILKAILLGTLAGFAGFLFHSFFDTFFYSVQLGAFMWLIMGLIVALPKINLSTS